MEPRPPSGKIASMISAKHKVYLVRIASPGRFINRNVYDWLMKVSLRKTVEGIRKKVMLSQPMAEVMHRASFDEIHGGQLRQPQPHRQSSLGGNQSRRTSLAYRNKLACASSSDVPAWTFVQ